MTYTLKLSWSPHHIKVCLSYPKVFDYFLKVGDYHICYLPPFLQVKQHLRPPDDFSAHQYISIKRSALKIVPLPSGTSGSKLFLFNVDTFLKRTWCAEKETGLQSYCYLCHITENLHGVFSCHKNTRDYKTFSCSTEWSMTCPANKSQTTNNCKFFLAKLI